MGKRNTAWANTVRREALCLPELICANTSRAPGNVVTDKHMGNGSLKAMADGMTSRDVITGCIQC